MLNTQKLRRPAGLAAIALTTGLAGCSKAVVLNPAGDIAAQQGQMVITATLLMLIIIVPVIALTLFFAWKYRQSNTEAEYDPEWHHSTTLELVIWTVPLMIIIALALAMVIDSFVVKHITGFRLGYFLPYAIPGVVASIIWVYLYNGQISPIVKGLAAIGINVDFFSKNVVLASMANITTWTFTGYNMLIFLAALQAIPHELYEAARIDGASGWQISMRIKLPNVRSAALLSMLLSIVGTIQLFNEPQIMQTADPGISKTYTPMMMAMNTSQGTLTPGGDGPASAVAIVMALIAGVLAMIYALVERKANEQ